MCVTVWGDGLKAGTEVWDDGNVINGDGCAYDCSAIETNWVWSGGSTTSKDTWTECMPGYHQNSVSGPTSWVTIWGDGLEAGTEKCDDNNTINGDGWKSDWSGVEAGWVCSGGSVSSKDTWTQWSTGYYQDNSLNPQTWVTHWGDSMKVGSEKWDDGNTIDGDGCKSDWSSVESGWVWSGGSASSKDTCTQCTAGFYQNDATTPTLWVTQWGDGKEAGTEKWDDGNANNSDGCNSSWTSVESSWVWTGGSTSSKDVWTFCTSGWYQNNAITPTTWVTQWGDGKEAGTEKCDDNNTIDGDGCKGDWSTVETGWVWIGGSTTTKDTCTFWTSGFYQNSSTNPETWVTHWGDGLKAGTEKCDDNNAIDGDGWKSDCSTVESSWVWSGGTTTSKDICTYCTSGWYQNDATTPTVWVTHWGDGKEAGSEKCDDGNTSSGDGWKSDWTSVESGWVCKGGSTTTKDVCEKWSTGFTPDSTTNPENWVNVCGDGRRVGIEIWDDGNTSNNDGWSSDWLSIDYDWAWDGGNIDNKDTCQKWHLWYDATSDKRDWIPNAIPYRIKLFSSIYLAIMGLGIVFNILNAKIYGASSISIFGVFYQIQMFMLIPLIGSDVSEDSIYFFNYAKDLLVSFYFIPNSFSFFGHGNVFSKLHYNQSNWYLNLIGFTSGSSLYNMNNYIFVWILIWMIAILIIPAYSCTKSQEPDSNRHKASKKAFDFLMSQFLIRFFMLSYQFLLIASLSEVKDFSRISKGTTSYIFSWFITLVWVLLFVLSIIKLISLRKEENFEALFYTKELFVGTKSNWVARTYSTVWILRRILYTSVFILFSNLIFLYKLISVLTIQGLYLVYLLTVRPFESRKDIIGEVSNEIFLFLGLLSMCYFNTESKWSTNATRVYLGFLLLSNIVFTSIAIGKKQN